MNFTLIDYSAFGLWILISVLISYILVDKLKFFKGDKNVKKVLAWGLILGHLLYLIWKDIFLKLIGN
jgi:membrane protein DedA with SNARE-associated domain